MKNPNFRPEIQEIVIDFNHFNTILLVFPIWWDKANLIKSFLDQIDLSNKKIIAYCTSGGSPLEPAVIDLQKTYPEANIVLGERM